MSALTFAEECNGSAIDPAKWVNHLEIWGEMAKDTWFPLDVNQQISAANGVCTITAERKANPAGRQFVSGVMTTYNRFSQAYGKFEARIKTPKGKALWPAFWLLPQATKWGPPEIDIMEQWPNPYPIGGVDYNDTGTFVHYGCCYGQGTFHQLWWKDGPDFTADYHTYGIEWRPGSIKMLVDGQVRGEVTQNIPSVPMYLIVNLSVGGDWPARADFETPSLSKMLIDYMRVYA